MSQGKRKEVNNIPFCVLLTILIVSWGYFFCLSFKHESNETQDTVIQQVCDRYKQEITSLYEEVETEIERRKSQDKTYIHMSILTKYKNDLGLILESKKIAYSFAPYINPEGKDLDEIFDKTRTSLTIAW